MKRAIASITKQQRLARLRTHGASFALNALPGDATLANIVDELATVAETLESVCRRAAVETSEELVRGNSLRIRLLGTVAVDAHGRGAWKLAGRLDREDLFGCVGRNWLTCLFCLV